MPIDSNCCCDRDVQNTLHAWICSGLVYRFDLIGSFGCDMLFCRNWHDILHFFLQDKKVNLFRPAVCGDPDLAIEAHAGSPWLAPSCCSTWTSLTPAPQGSGGTRGREMVWRCMLIHFSLSTILRHHSTWISESLIDANIFIECDSLIKSYFFSDISPFFGDWIRNSSRIWSSKEQHGVRLGGFPQLRRFPRGCPGESSLYQYSSVRVIPSIFCPPK